MMKEMKRIISMVLCLVMVLSLLPVGAVRVHAEETEPKIVDAAIMFSDLHSSSGDTKASVLQGVMGAVSGLPVSSVTSCGDAFSINSNPPSNPNTYKDLTSPLVSAIQSKLPGVPVNFVWSDHDRYAVGADDTTKLDNDSGFIYGAGTDGIYGTADDGNYYIYELSMADLSTYNRYNADFHSNSEVTATIKRFETEAAKLDQSKPLLIASHQPLLDRRNDNGHAYEWATAINTVAANMDVVFFFGHNHNHDKAEDYYYAKGSQMSVEGMTDKLTLNFTHACAGYLEPTSTGSYSQTGTRRDVVMAVSIYADSIKLTTYNKNGVYTGNFAVNETINRDHKLTSISVKAPDKVEYALSETFNAAGMEVTATYGSTKKVAVTEGYTLSEVDMNTVGKKTVTVSYQGKTATFTINVVAPAEEEPTLESIAIDSSKTYVVGDKLTVEATYSDGTTKDVSNGATFSAELSASGTYDITATYEGKTANVEDLKVYVYAEDDANLIGVQAYSEGATDLSVIWDDAAETYLNEVMDDYVVYDLALTNPGATTEYAMTLVDDMDVSKLVVYHVAEDGTLTKVDATLENDCVVFTTGLTGTFAYGVPSITINYELDSLAVSNPKKDYFVGDSLLITGDFEVTATYKAEGEKDDTRIVLPYEENNNPNGYLVNLDSFDMTTAGTYNVEITYGGKSVTFPITVWEKNFQDAPTSVSADISGAAFGVTGISVEVKEDDVITQAVKGLLEGNIAAYDIKLAGFTSGTVKVTLPIPEGVVNPAVYYVSDSGYNVIDMKAEKTEDGTGVTFTTDHFSTYVVGEGITITVPNEETFDGSDTTMTTQEKEVYVLVSSISGAGDYLISNTNSATTSAHLLTATNNGVTDTSGVTVTSGKDSDGNAVVYIESPASAAIWTATANDPGYRLLNTSTNRYLRVRSSALTTSNRNDASTMIGSNNTLRRHNNNYVYYNNGWTYSSSKQTVYIYQKQTVNLATTTTVSGTYSIAGENMSPVAIKDAAVDLSSTLSFTANGNVTNPEMDPSKLSYVVYDADGNSANGYTGDPLGVISGIDGNTVTLSGKVGKALVKVSYDTNGDADGGVVTNYITVETTTPDHYSIQLHLNEGGTLGEEITKPVALKGIKAGDTYSVWAVVKAHASAEDTEGMDIGKLGDALSWSVSDESIAKIDTETGVITFTGTNYGTVDVTVAYEGGNGKVITDTITISVTESQYIVPGDGTNDFPEYPNQGAVRFDKTATAVGNYSETGIAKVELSMTGVPYTSGNRLDVVLMLDRSSSMFKDGVKHRISSTVEATKAFVKNIVMNEDGSFNNNRILVLDFLGGNLDSSAGGGSKHKFQSNRYTSDEENGYQIINNQAELDALLTKIETDFKGQTSLYGTEYAQGLELCYNALKNSKGDGNQQFCVFMSDGIPNYMKGETTHFKKTTDIVAMFDVTNPTAANGTATRNATKYEYEHYSTQMKNEGVTVFTVGLGLKNTNSAWSNTSKEVCEQVANMLLNDISGPAKETAAQRDTGNAVSKLNKYFFSVADDNAAADMKNVFGAISQKIVEAARDVKVEDKIGNDYTLTFKLPTRVTNTEAGMEEFYIQVLEYQLDADKERTGTPAVLENFTFEHNGTIKTHTVNGVVTCEGNACNHVTFNPSRVTGINGTHFTYTCEPLLDANGNEVKNEFGDTITEEFLNWNADKLTTTELVLEYFAYLDNSAGYDADHQVPAGTYYTNEYATLTYKNYQGNEVQQEFPIPQMTWNGAQVTYVFYLVNDAGQPVNRAGRVIPFAESVYVTDPVTFNVTWNEQTGSENILAHDIFAEAGVPEVYELYDDSAQYVIRVYQTENVDKNGVNGNYFQISGDANKQIDSALDKDTDKNNSTTVVFNTKTGVKYDKYGIYSIYNAGTSLTNGTANINTTVKADDIDYANTTVAFAVVWKPELKEDTVVIDYGLDVVIDVIKNDNMAAGVVGVRTVAPKSGSEDVKINSGSFTSAKAQTVDVYIDTNNDTDGLKELKIGTAKVENMNQVRFSLNKDNGMQFTDPAVFYYEADVNFYDSNNDLQTTSMYSSVTVIPATTVYYEDEYVDLKVQTKNSAGGWDDADGLGWTTDGTTLNKTQAQDRPGESKISATLDADNNYGYDAAYKDMSTYSLDSAAKLNVTAGKRGIATFEFYGTGFDVIGVTSNTTGTIRVQVQGNNVNKSHVVDTYYGYTYENGEWVVSENTPNTLYQVPVMKIAGLPYGKYTVTITAAYAELFDHDQTCTCETDGCQGCYELYLDAIRIYDPTGVASGATENEVVSDAYEADGEAMPEYYEVRNIIINASMVYTKVEIEEFAEGVTYYTKNADGSYAVVDGEYAAETEYYVLRDQIVDGAVFIDGKGKIDTVADYISFGPNNEVYLAEGQSIAFGLNAPAKDGYKTKVQIGWKSTEGTVKLSYVENGSVKTAAEQEVATATDMYYDISALNGKTILIQNTGSGIISITNVKFSYEKVNASSGGSSSSGSESAVAEEAVSPFTIRVEDIEVILAYLRKPVVEEIVPEIPEVTEPEATEPEVTEPEVTEPEAEPETEPEKPDNTELKAAVEDAKKLKEKDYTKESFKAVKTALKEAEKVLKDKKATQAEIDEVLTELNEAVEALEANAPATKPGKNEKPEKETKPGKEEKPGKEDKPVKEEKPAKAEKDNQNKPANSKGPAAAEAAEKVADTVGAIAEALFGWMFR